MRFVIFSLVFFATFVYCDDKSSCEQYLCHAKYSAGGYEEAACLKGCSFRRSMSDGMQGFVDCHRDCDSTYSNATKEESKDEAKACHRACSLPMTSSVHMSVDLTGSEPKVEVVKHEGIDQDSVMQLGKPDFSALKMFLRPFGQNAKSEDDFFSTRTKIDDIDDDMNLMSERMRSVVENFLNNIQLSTNPELGGSRTRPAGHELVALTGPRVGNMDSGFPIIMEFDQGLPREFETLPQPQHTRQYFLRHLLLIVSCLSLLFVFSTLAFFYRYRHSEYYQRMRTNDRPSAVVSAPALEKKVPVEGWVATEPKSGSPPPAYDQLSVHSMKKSEGA